MLVLAGLGRYKHRRPYFHLLLIVIFPICFSGCVSKFHLTSPSGKVVCISPPITKPHSFNISSFASSLLKASTSNTPENTNFVLRLKREFPCL